MKLNAMLMTAALATASMLSANVYADNTTRVAAASALGSVAGTAVVKIWVVLRVQHLVQH